MARKRSEQLATIVARMSAGFSILQVLPLRRIVPIEGEEGTLVYELNKEPNFSISKAICQA